MQDHHLNVKHKNLLHFLGDFIITSLHKTSLNVSVACMLLILEGYSMYLLDPIPVIMRGNIDVPCT